MSNVDVRFITTTEAKLSTVTVVNGQLISLSDKNSLYYDMNSTRHKVRDKDSFIGTCSSEGSAQTKAVTVSDGDFELKEGALVSVKFANTNTFEASSSNPIKLNVNSTGAANIYFNGSATPEGDNPDVFGKASCYITYVYDGTYWCCVGGASGSAPVGGGHVILDDAGTSLAQEPNLQFQGTYMYDDSTNQKTVVPIVRSVTAAAFAQMSAAEKKGIVKVTDEPTLPLYAQDVRYGTTNVKAQLDKIFKIDATLTFTNLVATVSDERITSATCILVFYDDVSAATTAGITVESGTGVATFTAITAPSSTIGCSMICFN